MANSSSLAAPPPLPADAAGIEKKEEAVKVTVGGKDINVHTVQMFSSQSDLSQALTVFLLHGMKFSSQNWLDIKTMEHVANWGHRAVAIDLPSFKKTTENIKLGEEAAFLSAFIAKMEMKKIVIVSPSMSGGFALPYLFSEPKTSLDRAVGYVPVAPVGSDMFKDKYPDSELPTLIVYGTKDSMGVSALKNFSLLPKHEVAAIEGAGHACYLDNPDEFHKRLYHFLQRLSAAS